MSEVTTRPGASRGRGSSRGGRGGFSNRGGRPSGKPNGDANDASTPSAFDEDGDIVQLRKLYGSKVAPIKDMFQGWSDVDILYALQETDGDENLAVERIAHGAVAQWGEVSKPKKAARAKAKEAPTTSQTTDHGINRPSRGGRIVSDSGRGRGRGTDRGGRARARSTHPATNGARKETTNLSVPTEDSTAWDSQKTSDVVEPPKLPTETPAEQPAAIPDVPQAAAPPAPKTWASMLRQSTTAKAVPKPKEVPIEKPAEALEPLPSAGAPASETAEAPEPAPEAESIEPPVPAEELPAASVAELSPKVPLTESNLDQVDDTSGPTPTDTAASTAADSWTPVPSDARAAATPIAPSQQTTQIQPPPAVPAAGFAAVTPKIPAGRPQHYQRRILDQEEAVRMPGNREVDRAAVQFGAFSLSGTEDDIDGEREEAETRAQPPADSPIAHPRASLPPASQPHGAAESLASQKAPTPTAPAAAPTAPAAQVQAQQAAATPQAQPAVQPAQSFGRFGQAAQEGAPGFGGLNQGAAPASTQQQFDAFQAQQQAQQQASQMPHSAGAFSSAPGDFSSYYTADQHNRLPYNYYGQQYGQHQQQLGQGQQQEGVAAAQQAQPQRSFSGYTNPTQPDNLSQYPQSGVGALHNQSRFGGVAADPQTSGHTTPNPPTQAQGQQQPAGQAAAAAAAVSQPQSHGQQNYPYSSHPYFNNPYYHSYYAQAYGQGYGGTPYSKGGGAYGAPYNMPPQAPYDHSSSPAAGFQSSLQRENNGATSGLGDYGRGTSTQSGHQAALGGSSFGGMHDSTFGRGPSSFQSQGAPGFNAQSQGGAPSSANDELKPYGDSKTTAGPSPSIGGARPGSAANNAPTGQSGIPPQSNAQMGYGGYPSHLQQGLHGSGGYGASAGGQHGSTPYGSYGQQGQAGFSGAGFYGGGQQQQQQGQQQQQPQRGGWGGNYNH